MRGYSKSKQPLQMKQQTETESCLANVFQLEGSAPKYLPANPTTISEIKRRIQSLKRARLTKKSDAASGSQSQQQVVTYLHLTKKSSNSGEQEQVCVSREDQNDNLGMVFSPYKQKSPRVQKAGDESISWKPKVQSTGAVRNRYHANLSRASCEKSESEEDVRKTIKPRTMELRFRKRLFSAAKAADDSNNHITRLDKTIDVSVLSHKSVAAKKGISSKPKYSKKDNQTNEFPPKQIQTINYPTKNIKAQSKQNSTSSHGGFKIKRKQSSGLGQQQIHPSSNQTYTAHMARLHSLYNSLLDIAEAVKAQDPQIVINCIRGYIEQLSSGNIDFLDDFIDALQNKSRKLANFSRVMQNLSVIYTAIEVIKSLKEDNQLATVDLINFLTFTASNILFFVRLYSHFKRHPGTSISNFEAEIRDFQIASFKQELGDLQTTLLRMQHNCQMISQVEARLGRRNSGFSTASKKFMRNLDKDNYLASQSTHYLFEYLAYFVHLNALNNLIPFLDIAPNPYLYPSSEEHKYTIVLEPYGILYRLKDDKPVFRLYSRQFLQYLCRHFEVVLWTWMMPSDLARVLSVLDPMELVQLKLYRYHCKYENQIYVKNLNRLGRDVAKTLIVDYDPRIYYHTPQHGLDVGWNGVSKDQKLLDLTQILVELQKSVKKKKPINYLSMNVTYLQQIDVPEILKIYNQEVNALKMGQIGRVIKRSK